MGGWNRGIIFVMQLTLNREYAVRHLGVALLFIGLCGWFVYDGAVSYPRKDEAYFTETLHTTRDNAITRQFQFAGLSGLASLVIAFLVFRNWKATLSWDENEMTGSLTGGVPFAFSDIAGVNDSQWKRKGILVVLARDGRRVTLDSWHHAGAKELAEKIIALVANDKGERGGDQAVK